MRNSHQGQRVCVRTRKTDIRAEKFESGQERQRLKRVCENRGKNRRSLHYAPPDFLSRALALIQFMRFPLRETAHVVLASAAK